LERRLIAEPQLANAYVHRRSNDSRNVKDTQRTPVTKTLAWTRERSRSLRFTRPCVNLPAPHAMRIGLTYALRDHYLGRGFTEDEVAEFESGDTVQALLQTIAALGHQPIDIGHIRTLTERLADGERWDLVFNIAEGVRGAGRETQVPALLEAYEIPYTFS